MLFPLSYPAYHSYSRALLTCNSTINTSLVISTTRYDNSFGAFLAKYLASIGSIKLNSIHPLNMNITKVVIVKNIRKVVSSLIFDSIELSKLNSANRIGPTFNIMVLSNIKVAKEAIKVFKERKREYIK